MNKNLFSALVIDDEKERNSTYIKVLSRRFNTEIVNDINSIDIQKLRQYDLLIIDVCLSRNVKSLTAFKLMQDLRLTTPTVLISGEWIKDKSEPNEDILLVPKFKNVIKLISWNSFIKEECAEKNAEEIYYDFCKYRKFSTDSCKDKLIILQLSDLQFGGNNSGTTLNDNRRLSHYLKDNGKTPDIILITGDIADKGKKEEYHEAKVWLESLIKDLYGITGVIPDDIRQKIIMVPGNHDYDLSLGAADVYSFKFGQENLDSYEKNNSTDVVFSHQKLGLKNYFDFAYELTGDLSWNNYETSAVHINDHFYNLGVCFVLFNSVYNINCRNCENKHDNFYCNLNDFSDDDLDCDLVYKKDFTNILVMHNPPENFHRETEAGQKSKNKLQALIEDNHVKLCFYGHSHDYVIPHEWSDNGGPYCEKMICVSAPTYRLAAASRTEDAMRGFNIIELSKDSSDYYNHVNVINFEVVKAEISIKKERDFSI